mgnify:CR=1 FL=1
MLFGEIHLFVGVLGEVEELGTFFLPFLKVLPRPEEREMAEKGRRSLHARVDISKGSVVTDDMLVVKRPGLGIAPVLREHVIGRKAARLIEQDEWITWDALA